MKVFRVGTYLQCKYDASWHKKNDCNFYYIREPTVVVVSNMALININEIRSSFFPLMEPVQYEPETFNSILIVPAFVLWDSRNIIRIQQDRQNFLRMIYV